MARGAVQLGFPLSEKRHDYIARVDARPAAADGDQPGGGAVADLAEAQREARRVRYAQASPVRAR